MILGVAQIVVNLAELAGAREELLDGGYSLSFAEARLPNHPAKAPFQAAPREALALEHFAAPAGGMAVELTAYAGPPPGGRASYERQDDAVLLPASEPQASTAFWTEGLGFRAGDEPDVLQHPAVLPAWRLRVRLTAAPPPREEATVDADGCVLVTVLTTDLDAELSRLAGTHALRWSDPWDEQVAGRELRVAVVQGPSGELVELLQAPRTTTR